MTPVIYHVGFLVVDRQQDRAVDDRAKSLLRQAEAGQVELTQRRIGTGRYEYLVCCPATEARSTAA